MHQHFPHYFQNEMMDCGPACLRMVAKYYGRYYTLQTLRRKCFITREGVSLLGISDAAESIGFRTNGVKLRLKQLVEEAKLPCILHWNQNHFVVLHDVKTNRKGESTFYIADPASQLIKYKQDEFCKCWLGSSTSSDQKQGTALLLEPGVNFADTEDEPEKSTKKDLLFFLRYLLPYKSLFAQLAVGMFLGSALQMTFPLLTQSLVDVGINGKNLNFITLILIVQLALFVAQLVVGFIRSWIMLHINTKGLPSTSLLREFLGGSSFKY